MKPKIIVYIFNYSSYMTSTIDARIGYMHSILGFSHYFYEIILNLNIHIIQIMLYLNIIYNYSLFKIKHIILSFRYLA